MPMSLIPAVGVSAAVTAAMPSIAALGLAMLSPQQVVAVQTGSIYSTWVYSATQPAHPACIARRGGGWWVFQPTEGRVYAGMLDSLAHDVAVCAATGARLVVRSGTMIPISATIDTAPINIECEPGSSIVGTNLFGPAIRFNVAVETSRIRVKLNYILSTTTTGDQTDTCALYIQDAPGANPATTPFWYNDFDIDTYNCSQAAVMDRGTFTDAYGSESYNNYNTWRVGLHGDGQYYNQGFSRYGVTFKQGSGTGNIFYQFRGALGGVKPAWIRVQGKTPGTDCGDMLVVGCHLGGTNAAVFSFGAGLAYNDNIAVVGSQMDAGMTPLAWFDDTTNETFLGVKVVGCNVGGGTDLFAGCPAMAQAVICDKNASDWRVGRSSIKSVSGPTTDQIFTVVLGPWTGAEGKIVVSGLVGGLAGGMVSQTFFLASTNAAASVTLGPSGSNPASPPAGFFSLGFTVSGLTVTFTLSYSSSNQVTSDSQLHLCGGTFVARGLP